MPEFDLTQVRPYGDTLDDGIVQLSFTLPVPCGPEAREAALQILRDIGFVDPKVVHMEDLTGGFTFFILYACCPVAVDYSRIRVPRVAYPRLSFDEINELIETRLGRPMVVIGACTGSDAHTVGIDAIMNMKGYAGHYGLERYRWIRAFNLGAQVSNEALVARAVQENADVVLVSKVVTQKNLHIEDLTQLIEILEAQGIRRRIIAVAGGPRITHELATEMGYDAGCGPGTYAEDVASFCIQELLRRQEK